MKLTFAMLAAFPVLAAACLNDRDTVAFETRNVNALERVTNEQDPVKQARAVDEIVLRALGGRFDRFPARYYEMRIKRLNKLPTLLPKEYDDLAVAYDRLGKVNQAIAVIQRSRMMRASSDDLYSYHANYGTFLVHRWILKGHTAADLGTLEESISEIKEALKINPNSHFGREAVQLQLEQFWHDSAAGVPTASLAASFSKPLNDKMTMVGFSGLIMMGLAYQLPDVYAALATSKPSTLTQSIAYKAYLELIKSGKKPVGNLAASDLPDKKFHPDSPAISGYKRLVMDGEKVQLEREDYMEERFDRGEHPDTHPKFWNEWVEPGYPVVHEPDRGYVMQMKAFEVLYNLTFLGIIVLPPLGIFLLLRRFLRSKAWKKVS